MLSLFAEESGVTLQQLIGSPPPKQITQADGPDGRPVYLFGEESSSGQPARAHLPNPFYRDFSLVFQLKPTSEDAGVIFAITDSDHTVMYVGVKLSAVENNTRMVKFFYTEPGANKSAEVASFNVSYLPEDWSRFSLAVNHNQISFYEDCESEPKVVNFERSSDDIQLDLGAGIFVGHAGTADPDKYKVGPAHVHVTAEHGYIIWSKSSIHSNLII